MGCEPHRNKRSGLGQKRETVEGETRTKKWKNKPPAKTKQKSFFLGKIPMLGLKLRAFPDVPRGRPLDHRRGLIRSTWPTRHQQKTYLPYVSKIVLEQLTPFSVVQIVLLYYHSSTIPGCAPVLSKDFFSFLSVLSNDCFNLFPIRFCGGMI